MEAKKAMEQTLMEVSRSFYRIPGASSCFILDIAVNFTPRKKNSSFYFDGDLVAALTKKVMKLKRTQTESLDPQSLDHHFVSKGTEVKMPLEWTTGSLSKVKSPMRRKALIIWKTVTPPLLGEMAVKDRKGQTLWMAGVQRGKWRVLFLGTFWGTKVVRQTSL